MGKQGEDKPNSAQKTGVGRWGALIYLKLVKMTAYEDALFSFVCTSVIFTKKKKRKKKKGKSHSSLHNSF